MNKNVMQGSEMKRTHIRPTGSLFGILCDKICFSINKIEREAKI